ncbi:internal scaffolding protein [Apis mellifera associated microvirus 5]|nr:internal scaffolding protein [Apis mellifera associated microvirus 5]AZL82842.1 internal scaffolding protein [Apis mellifera associated microvirus 5]
MEFQSAYSKPFRGSDLKCDDPSLAQQHFKDDVDINVLLERFKVTGQLPQGVRLPTYGDFTGVTDFRQANEAIRHANESFMDLPANIRARFQNDPVEFVEFCSDKENLPELRKMGLAPEILGSGAEPQVGPSGAAAPEGPKV